MSANDSRQPFDEFGSPIPNVTDEELRRHVVTTRRDVSEIKAALLGTKYGSPGIVQRLDLVEAKTELHDRKLLVWGAIISFVGVLLVYIKDFLHKPQP